MQTTAPLNSINLSLKEYSVDQGKSLSDNFQQIATNDINLVPKSEYIFTLNFSSDNYFTQCLIDLLRIYIAQLLMPKPKNGWVLFFYSQLLMKFNKADAPKYQLFLSLISYKSVKICRACASNRKVFCQKVRLCKKVQPTGYLSFKHQ